MTKSDLPMQVQSPVPFSQSMVWRAQREYYDTQGVEAWSEQVPFYVTSNPYIADQYAKILLRFFQDTLEQSPSSKNHPFYVIELGAGTGQFGFYTLKRLLELQKSWQLHDLTIRYVLTDFTPNNLEYWNSHPAFQSMIRQGDIDFALFDIEQDTTINLMHSGDAIGPWSLHNPISVVANYLFDSVVSDVFRVKDGTLEESLVHISIGRRFINNQKVQWEKAKLSYTNRPAARSYYDHPQFDKILRQYQTALSDSYVQFPVGALRGIEALSRLSEGRLLLVSSDKGHVSLSELDELDQPELTFHGSFSTMVNYHAIAEFFNLNKGASYLQELFDAFATGVFSLGFDLNHYPRLRSTLSDTVGSLAAGHYYHLYDHFVSSVDEATLETIGSMMTLSKWDPAIFELASSRISDLLADADDDVVGYIASGVQRIAENYYHVPGSNDVLFELGVFHQENENFLAAIALYEGSMMYFDEGYEVLFNLGYCHYELDNREQSLSFFEKAKKYHSHLNEINHYIEAINKKNYLAAL